eukprot:5809456-Prymnesium_polylepis.1
MGRRSFGRRRRVAAMADAPCKAERQGGSRGVATACLIRAARGRRHGGRRRGGRWLGSTEC